MKKLNKLLMPIAGLTTIAAAAAPMVACSKTTQFTVKFDTQGGSTIADMKIDKDSVAIEPKDPTKSGYDFAGWYTEKECTNKFDFTTKITANITLYAKWDVQFDGKVNETEWIKALAYISANVDGATWKSSSEDAVEIFRFDQDTYELESFDEYSNIAFNDDLGVMTAISSEDGETEAGQASIIHSNDLYYMYAIDTQGEQVGSTVTKESIIQECLTDVVTEIGGWVNYDFDNTIKTYVFAGETTIGGAKAYATSKVKFNANKQITYINCHAVIMNDAAGSQLKRITNVELHPMYENVTVDVDQQLIDKAKAHSFVMPSTKKLDITTLRGTEHEDAISLKISNQAIANGDTLTLEGSNTSNAGLIDHMVIYKGNTQLSEGTDYVKSYASGKETITFKTAVAATDSLSIIMRLSSSAVKFVKLTFTLTIA